MCFQIILKNLKKLHKGAATNKKIDTHRLEDENTKMSLQKKINEKIAEVKQENTAEQDLRPTSRRKNKVWMTDEILNDGQTKKI